MGLAEGILILALVVIAMAFIGWVRRRMRAQSPDALENVLGRAHERIDDIELARVRSMLHRR